MRLAHSFSPGVVLNKACAYRVLNHPIFYDMNNAQGGVKGVTGNSMKTAMHAAHNKHTHQILHY